MRNRFEKKSDRHDSDFTQDTTTHEIPNSERLIVFFSDSNVFWSAFAKSLIETDFISAIPFSSSRNIPKKAREIILKEPIFIVKSMNGKLPENQQQQEDDDSKIFVIMASGGTQCYEFLYHCTTAFGSSPRSYNFPASSSLFFRLFAFNSIHAFFARTFPRLFLLYWHFFSHGFTFDPMPSLALTQFVLQRLVGLTCLIAISGLALQVIPLFGENGIMPISEYAKAIMASPATHFGVHNYTGTLNENAIIFSKFVRFSLSFQSQKKKKQKNGTDCLRFSSSEMTIIFCSS